MYTLKKSFLSANTRHGSFKPDEDVSGDKQANDSTYDDKNFDKGHLTPDADFRFDDAAEAQTFLYTNAAPQQEYMNEHLWANLEKHGRDLCRLYGNIKVYTGCLFGSKKLHGVDVPAYFWKVLIYTAKGKKIKEAYQAKNVRPASNVYTKIICNFSTLQRKTGLVFK